MDRIGKHAVRRSALIAATAPVLGLLAACGADSGASTAARGPMIGMANPASEYCLNTGGTLEIRTETDGQVGYCHLPDGRVVEEWALYRAEQAPENG